MKQVEKLLESHGFKHDQKTWEYMNYKKMKIPHENTIMAHFGNDKQLACTFTLALYEKVFNLTLDNMELRIG